MCIGTQGKVFGQTLQLRSWSGLWHQKRRCYRFSRIRAVCNHVMESEICLIFTFLITAANKSIILQLYVVICAIFAICIISVVAKGPLRFSQHVRLHPCHEELRLLGLKVDKQ